MASRLSAFPRLGGDGEMGHAPQVPGKRSLSDGLVVQRRTPRPAAPPASESSAPPAREVADDPFALHLPDAHAIARSGVDGTGQPLPHGERIQAAFGHHDVGRITAHVGGSAATASAALGADAYATGNAVAFRTAPDLHTAAHEAAHVIQQRAGVQLRGGFGTSGDRYEQHADAVADAVVRGESAAGLLDTMTGDGAAGADAVQRKAGIEYETSIPVRRTKGYDDKDENQGHVTQDETMLVGNGWQVDSDNSKLEFVTEPAVEIDALGDIVDDMLDVVSKVPTKLDKVTPLEKVVPGKAQDSYVVPPYAKSRITGSPQGTIGVPYEKLFSFFDLLTRYGMQASETLIGEHKDKLQKGYKAYSKLPTSTNDERDEKEKKKKELDLGNQTVKDEQEAGTHAISEGDRKSFSKIAKVVSGVVDPLDKEIEDSQDRERLKGLLHFIGQYLLQATQNASGYLKKRFAVMARSSFHSMYDALGKQAKGCFGKAASTVVEDLGFDGDTKIFEKRKCELSVEEWMTSIENPKEMVIPDKDDKYGRTVISDRMTAPGAWDEYPTDKSMGSMGLDGGLVVVELRALKHFCKATTFTPSSMRKLVGDLKVLIAAK